MVNAQEWLDQNYPVEERKDIVEVNICDKELEGELKLDDFDNLEILECEGNQITSIDVSKCPKLKLLICADNQLAELDLRKNEELEALVCWVNKLTELNITNCQKLKRLGASINLLTKLDLTGNSQLEDLDICDNNFGINEFGIEEKQDLSFLSHLVNLRKLFIANSDKSGGSFNRFSGNLESLKDMKKLELLGINDSGIDYDKKYLPNNVVIFNWYSRHRPSFQISSSATFVASVLTSPGSNLRGGEISYWTLLKWSGNVAKVISIIDEELEVKRRIKEEVQKNWEKTNLERWKEIHPNFTPELRKEWEDKGFTHEQMKEWVKLGLHASDADFAHYLREKKDKSTDELQYLNQDKEELRKEFYENQKKYGVQGWLDAKYPKEKRKDIEELDISDEDLKGNLDLKDFVNLKVLNCDSNELTSLEIDGLTSLESLDCRNNSLKDISLLLSNLNNPEKLKSLNLADNDFSESNLDPFSKFVNLESLRIGSSDEKKIQQGVYNRFTGSLKPLENLTKLENLDIINTDIDSGLKYLQRNLKNFYCCSDDSKRRGARVTKLYDELHGSNGEVKTVQAWKEINAGFSAEEWINKEYPETGKCLGNFDQKNKGKKREQITDLDISEKELKGELELKGFNKLKTFNCSENYLKDLTLSDCRDLIKLNCSNNQLTKLDLRKNIQITELNCSGNKLTDLDISKNKKLVHLNCSNNELLITKLLDQIPNKEKLKILKINNNKKLESNLESLVPFKKLIELNIENCPFRGSLKHLEGMNELKKIFISHTNIEEGLDYLPDNCKELYCDKSMQITKELGKRAKIDRETIDNYQFRCYDLDKWRAEKQSNLMISLIPSERLFVIRSHLKQFLKKWGTKDKDNQIELSKLQSPQEFSNYKYLSIPQWGSRATTVAGGILTLAGQPIVGGIMAATSPFIDVAASQAKESFYDAKISEWNEFKEDADIFLDNYNELLGILKKIEVGELGSVNLKLKELNNKVIEFLEEYDEDGNEEIDIEELVNERAKFAEELDKLEEIVEAMKNLEEEIINYRQGSLNEKESEEKERVDLMIKELFKKATKNQEVKEIEKKIGERLPKQEIQKVLLLISMGQKGKKQFLVISKTKENLLSIFNPKKKLYSLDLVESNSKEEIKIKNNKDFPQWFSSEKEVIEKAQDIVLERKINKILKELKKKTEPGERNKEEINGVKKEKLISIIKRGLEEREKVLEKKENNSGDNSKDLPAINFFTTIENIITECITEKKGLLCYICEQWKKRKESERLTQEQVNNKGKTKEVIPEQEIISEPSVGESSLQAQVQIPPKQ